MAAPAITEASIKSALTERLNATHVEVTDMSGKLRPTSPVTPDFSGSALYKSRRVSQTGLQIRRS
jgi:hypothetical protein